MADAAADKLDRRIYNKLYQQRPEVKERQKQKNMARDKKLRVKTTIKRLMKHPPDEMRAIVESRAAATTKFEKSEPIYHHESLHHHSSCDG